MNFNETDVTPNHAAAGFIQVKIITQHCVLQNIAKFQVNKYEGKFHILNILLSNLKLKTDDQLTGTLPSLSCENLNDLRVDFLEQISKKWTFYISLIQTFHIVTLYTPPIR